MFWNKKKKKEDPAKSFTDPMAIPGFKQNADGSFSLSLDDLGPIAEPTFVTDRIYVISRGNIDLKEAQNITIHAAMNHPEFAENLLTEGHVDLVWCSAYPDALFGDYDLQTLLTGYIDHSEGNTYVKGDSPMIPIEGTKDGDDYYILILVHPEY